jgi:phage terminase large subunit-like protein
MEVEGHNYIAGCLVHHNTCIAAVETWKFVRQGGKVFRVVGSLGFEKGIRDIIYPELKKWIPPSRILKEKPNSQGIIVKIVVSGDNGKDSIISLMSGEQDDQSFEGDLIDGAWIDEPCRKAIYTATLRGLLMSNGPLIMTLTPLSEPWIYNEIFCSTDKDVECFTGTMEDALIENGGHLSREAMESFISKLTQDEIDARVYGKFKHLIGRVYGAFDEKIHVIDPFRIPKEWPVYSGIDPHTRKNNAGLWVAVSPDENLYVCNEVWYKAGIETFGRECLEVSKQYSVVCRLIDTSSETPDWNRRETARSLLQKIGLSTRLARKNNQKETSRLLITQALEGKGDDPTPSPRLFVFRSCRRTVFEFNNYVYDNFSDPDSQGIKEEPKKINDDMLDILGYIMVERPRFKKPATLAAAWSA